MAYDPYKSLLANATREHIKRNADLNTHLVGNVFLPAIDAQCKKTSASKNKASLQHLKVIEQCIQAENKREERLAKCATTKDRRALTKKFQVQRERERELIQALMLGDYPERVQEIKLLQREIEPATTPRQQLNQETTGLTSKIPPPDRVFRKADVTGGVPKAKPHAHKKFKLPQCNGSPGKKGNLRAQAAAAANLSSPSRGSTTTRQESRSGDVPNRSLARSSRSDYSARSPKLKVKHPDTRNDEAEDKAKKPKVRSPRISPLRNQEKEDRPAPQFSSKPAEPTTQTFLQSTNLTCGEPLADTVPRVFEGALSFSEAQRRAMGLEADLFSRKREINVVESGTQTTPRLVPSLPPVVSLPALADPNRDSDATTPRRPQSVRVFRSTHQAFLENLAKESKLVAREANSNMTTKAGKTADEDNGAYSTESFEPEDGGGWSCAASDDVVERTVDATDSNDTPEDKDLPDENTQEEVLDSDTANSDGNSEAADAETVEATATASPHTDEELEVEVAEILFDLIEKVAVAIEEEAKRETPRTTRTVSPRPRSSMGRTSKHVLRIQALFRGHRARVAFRLALYEDALSCGVLGAMPGTIQGRSGWYLDPKRLMAYYFEIPTPDGDWEQKHAVRCTRLVLTPYDMQLEVLSKMSLDDNHDDGADF